MSYIETLHQTRILQGLSTEQLESLMASSQIETYQRGQVVFEEGSVSRDIYIVLEGEVAVKLDPANLGTIERGSVELHLIRTIGRGESFGEQALVEARPRTATIIATCDNTILLIIPAQWLTPVLDTHQVLSNITRDISSELRRSNARMLESMLSSYYLTALVEDLTSTTPTCSPITPLEKHVVIRSPDSFILSGPDHLIPDLPEKEVIDILFFAQPTTLYSFATSGLPSAAVSFSALFSVIRSGRISDRITDTDFHFHVADVDRRNGTFTVSKTLNGQLQDYTLKWQLKGARYDHLTRTTSAYLFLYIYDDDASSTESRAQQMIADIAMPVQKHIASSLAHQEFDPSHLRVIMIHHRSHEVARTLQTMRDFGYQLDSFIGIPYGDVNWEYITMLDQAAGHQYLSLKLITHPTEPTRYQFDFSQSSWLNRQTEQDLLALFTQPDITYDYMVAMQMLTEYRLLHALQTCRERGERLLVYEDGGYIAGKIYELYRDPTHPGHALVQAALNDGIIVGVVEVTVAGERKNMQVIQENNGRALLPVLSNARSDLKAIYESVGVSEAVIHAAASSFGRLGLPTFQTRRIAVIGGNGAIGTRVIEQLTLLHNSTANVFAVDLSNAAFELPIDAIAVPHAATRLKYRQLPRYTVADTCLPIIFDVPFSDRGFRGDGAAIMQAIQTFLADPENYDELALTNSYPLPTEALQHLWEDIEQRSGFRQVEGVPLAGQDGICYRLARDDIQKSVTLLAAHTVLTFRDVSRLIGNGVDTIIGCTGYPILSPKNLDAFFVRQSATNQVDELVLISASSKDYEFRRGIDLLNGLLKLDTQAAIPVDTQLAWFTQLYTDELSFVQGTDFPAIRSLLSAPITAASVEAFTQAAPAVAVAMGLCADRESDWPAHVANYIATKIRQQVTIRKEIRPDIGSIYHLRVNERAKRVVLLADGLVVNFFARHEKGVKTEYIDPIVTMQLLSLVKLSGSTLPAGLHKMDAYLRPEDMATLWAAINASCAPLLLH